MGIKFDKMGIFGVESIKMRIERVSLQLTSRKSQGFRSQGASQVSGRKE